MLRAKPRKPWQDRVLCDECGREWHEVKTPNFDGPDNRGFVSIFGALGDLTVKRTLCPQCVEDLIDALAESVDRETLILANRDYANERAEEILWGLMPVAEPEGPVSLQNRQHLKRRARLLASLDADIGAAR